jgi:hypothetical protein
MRGMLLPSSRRALGPAALGSVLRLVRNPRRLSAERYRTQAGEPEELPARAPAYDP